MAESGGIWAWVRGLKTWQKIAGGFLLLVVVSTIIGPKERSADAPVAAAPAKAGPGMAGKPEDIANRTTFSVILPANADLARVEGEARAFCADKQFCQVMGWTDEANRAKSMPMLAREADAQAFNYSVNRTSGYESALWDCRRFKAPAGQCMAVPDPEPRASASMGSEGPRKLATAEIAAAAGADCKGPTGSEYKGKTAEQVFYVLHCTNDDLLVSVKMDGSSSFMSCRQAAVLGVDTCAKKWD